MIILPVVKMLIMSEYEYMQMQMNYSDSQMSLGVLYLHTQQKRQTFIKR